MKIEIIRHSEEPHKWNALHIAGESNIYVGIVQLRRIGFSFEEIRGLLEIPKGRHSNQTQFDPYKEENSRIRIGKQTIT